MTGLLERNHGALGSELERIAGALRGDADGAETEAAESERPPRLERLVAAFGLSSFERDVLLLCAGVELDAQFGALCGQIDGGDGIPRPSFSLALSRLEGAHWSALAPAAPLRHYLLITLDQGESPVTSRIRIDERVLHDLIGIDYLDPRLQGLACPVSAPAPLPPTHEAVSAAVAWALVRGAGGAEPVVMLVAADAGAIRSVTASAFARLGLALHALPAAEVPAHASERDALCRLWQREAVLGRSGLLLEVDDEDDPGVRRRAAAFADALGGVVVVGAREPLAALRRPPVRFDLPGLSTSERRDLWVAALGKRSEALDGAVDVLAGQFDLGPQAIAAVSAQVAQVDDDGGLSAALWSACRLHARPRLDDLAQQIVPLAGWDDLVLPESELGVLREIAVHVRGRARVYEQWGFARKSSRGLGISALFEGASGTGKTMAAEVLADDLQLDLYRIDLSQVVSKYIGETEKNLRRVFDAADRGGAILLFDEADALFGKRSEVKDSHDRYANIEVSYLLQRMEEYRGLAILTTNRRDALDEAFLRRIRFAVRFPFPDREARAAIWRRIFPPDAPTEGLDEQALSELSLAGGNIRNIALGAAFLAADESAAIGMPQLALAAARECAKLERPLTEEGLRRWL